MAYCKECKETRDDHLTYCPVCSNILLNPDDVEKVDGVKEVLLTTISIEEESLVVEGLLKSAEIFYIRRYDRIGDYLKVSMGTTTQGVSLYVREDDYDFAKSLLESEPEDLDALYEDFAYREKEGDEISQAQEQEQDDSSKIGIQIIIMLFFLMFLIYLAAR
ncbi:hypothetical protein HYG86_10160 [Alkalicella caledoniensis]|uniref:DUF2007 domain-containing protein n=1 Tax=Alkalicella caledoniensis TaxID=2731377 RepID=A0A7G9W8T6_ALKCA|nr:hypothetical protein [Alkalicella caledoniensis]QNO15098.1 hypothetical protein HYG86_10160 [Alkalicella caledoniensis]